MQPTNRPALVQEVLTAAHLDATAPVRLEADELDLATALTERLELSVLTRDVLERYAAVAPQHASLRQILANKPGLGPYLYGRDVADLLTEFPVELSGQQLAAVLRPLPARAYSIASSLLAHPEEVHLTVGAVRYEARGRARNGACSGYQADHLAVGEPARVWIDRNEYFKLPADPATNIIMVGPGTGVAPFRAFVEERAETGAAGRNWLLFGNPHFTTDFLYQTEWQQHLKRGTLSRPRRGFLPRPGRQALRAAPPAGAKPPSVRPARKRGPLLRLRRQNPHGPRRAAGATPDHPAGKWPG